MAIRTVACIGAGYVGGPTMAVMADRCPDIHFVVADRDEGRVRAWNSGVPPIHEPGLEPLLRSRLGRNLEFTTDVGAAVRRGELIFVSVNTPTKTFGEGAGMAADLQFWEASARAIRSHADGPRIVVEKSTVPVRTAEAMERILNDGIGPRRFEVLSNPEFLAEGTAVRDLLEPDRVLIGGRDTPEGRAAVAELVEIYARWVPRDRILTMSVWSAELAKLAANAFLAQRISSINSIAELCEATGADIREVARAIGLDRRIGPRFLEAGIGFGGSCFRKDLLNLAYLCRAAGLDAVADYWIGVVRMNERQQGRFVAGMVRRMFNTLAEKRIALFGFAFKADTGDTRDSPAIAVARALLAERAHLAVTDPQALENARRDLADVADRVEFYEDPYAAARGAHAIAVLTAWREYRELDWARLYAQMERPAFVFDGRNLLDADALHRIGFNVVPVGSPPRIHGGDPAVWTSGVGVA
ncbi:MAG: nucleotide sugar dehydrogenase [Kiritimatiellae bacterium]|nr:nucleotide sugar dehydrogenase [Kiritimatiellia bacterium]